MTTSKKAKIITTASLLLLLTIVIFQNTEMITTQILFAEITMRQAFLLLLTFFFGALFGFTLACIRVNKRAISNIKMID